jgi:predicted permease
MPDPSTRSGRDWGPEIRARLKDVRLSPAREAEIVEELSQHRDERWRALVAGGASPDEALRMARVAFADRNILAEDLAPLRQAHWTDPTPPAASRAFSLEGLVADVRQAVRALRASPAFSVVSLLVLALGIGATTAIFSVVDAVVLRGLPFDEADRLVAVGRMSSAGPPGPGKGALPSGFFPGRPGFSAADPDALSTSSPQNWLEWVAGQQVFESMAAIAPADHTLRLAGGDPEELRAERVTASFFDVFRVRPAIGRAFTQDEEVDGRHQVAVLSHAFWQRRFGGNPDIVGQTLALDDDVYEVVGVMPAGLPYSGTPANAAALWTPYVISPGERVPGGPIGLYLQVVARLKPGITLEQARTQMTQTAAAIERTDPERNRGTGVGVRPLADLLVGARMQSWMLMLLAAVGLVLVIACANVANLLLARAAARERDVALRTALGASRWRLVRQFLVENLVLSSAGFVLGAMLAWWAVEILRAAIPDDIPRADTIAINLRVLAAAAGLAVATGSVFGLAPAILASRPV